MLKVLIVDDDILVRNKLRSIIDWEKHGFTICGEAVNGLEALASLELYTPDLVIMDVSMPVMNGIQLCEVISSKYKFAKMIVLSSFDNFEYVRDTLKKGAIDYLLKHNLSPVHLVSILEKVKDLIYADMRKQKDMELVYKRLESVNPILVQKYIKELIWGIGDNLELLKENFKAFNIQVSDKNIIVVVMQLVNFMAATEFYSNKEIDSLINSVMDLCNNMIQVFKNGCITYMEQGRFVILFSFENLRSESEISGLLKSYIEKIENAITKFFNINTVYGCSNILTGLKELPRAYDKAFQAAESKLCEYDKPAGSIVQSMPLSIKHEKEILLALENLEVDAICIILDEVFTGMKKNGANYNSIQLVICELISIAHKAALNGGLDIQGDNNHEIMIRERLKQCKRLDEIHGNMKALYCQLCNDLKKYSLKGRYSKYIQDSIDYIYKHYSEDISLEDAAKNVNISPPYLSRLFKEEVKMGFSEYLNLARIEAAKKLIGKGERRPKDIFKKVGFNNYNYFIRVFKEVTGSTPLSFSIKNENLYKKL